MISAESYSLGPANPNLPVCSDCGREFHEELGSVIHVGLDVWCAKKRIEIENAERAIEAAEDEVAS